MKNREIIEKILLIVLVFTFIIIGKEFPISFDTKAVVSKEHTYYVSTDGCASDSNDGLAPICIDGHGPFKTINVGINVLEAGDKLLIGPGEYWGGITINSKFGSAVEPIEITALDPNNKPVIKAIGYGFTIVNSSYLTISNLEFTDVGSGSYNTSAIAVDFSDHITITDNYIHLKLTSIDSETGEPVGRQGHTGDPPNTFTINEYDGKQNIGIYLCKTVDSIITHNKIEKTDEAIYIGHEGVAQTYDCGIGIDSVRVWNENNTITYNLIDTVWGEGVELKPDTRNNIVAYNTIRDAVRNESSAIEVRGHDNTITKNVILASHKNGIRLASEYAILDAGATDSYCTGNTVSYNYIFDWDFENESNSTESAIVIHETAIGGTIVHNTIYGEKLGWAKIRVDQPRDSIRSLRYPSGGETTVTIKNNLVLGGIDANKSSHDILVYDAIASTPNDHTELVSDYNAYNPPNRDPGSQNYGVVSIGDEGTDASTLATIRSAGFEVHSLFLDSSPVNVTNCTVEAVGRYPFATAIEDVYNKVLTCAKPLEGSAIIGSADDGENIGAFQEGNLTLTPTPTSTPTNTPTPTLTPTPTSSPTPIPTPTSISTLSSTPTSTPATTVTSAPTTISTVSGAPSKEVTPTPTENIGSTNDSNKDKPSSRSQKKTDKKSKDITATFVGLASFVGGIGIFFLIILIIKRLF